MNRRPGGYSGIDYGGGRICACGLFAYMYLPNIPQEELSLPIQKVEVKAKVVSDFFCEVTILQHFINQAYVPKFANAQARNVRYVFPLEESSAVCGFRAILGSGLIIDGKVKEKKKARREFNEAVSEGKKAALMSQKTSEVFTCEIGNLAYNETCIVEIKYVTELQLESDAVKFVLPTVVAPKYGGRESNTKPYPISIDIDAQMSSKIVSVKCPSHEVKSAIDENDTSHAVVEFLGKKQTHVGVSCDGCLMDPLKGKRWKCETCPDFDLCDTCHDRGMHPHSFRGINLEQPEKKPLPQVTGAAAEVHDGVQCDACMMVPIQGERWKCTTCPDYDLCKACYKKGWHPHRFTRVMKQEPPRDDIVGGGLNDDFVLYIKQDTPFRTRALIEYSAKHDSHAVQLTFCRKPMDVAEATELPCELIFLVDTSGSMAGSNMNDVKNTLQMFLRSLPTECIFNIVRFSNSHSSMAPRSYQYGQAALDKASKYVDNLHAGGGTNILNPLTSVLKQRKIDGFPRQVFLLTDGQVHNTDQVIEVTRKYARTSRVFTFGIGRGTSRHLCKGVARAGNGTAEFVIESSKIGEKVMRSLTRALQESLCGVTVDWSGFEGQAEGLTVTQSPSEIPPIYSGDRYFVYGIKGMKSDELDKNVADFLLEEEEADKKPCCQCKCKAFKQDKWSRHRCGICRHSDKNHGIGPKRPKRKKNEVSATDLAALVAPPPPSVPVSAPPPSVPVEGEGSHVEGKVSPAGEGEVGEGGGEGEAGEGEAGEGEGSGEKPEEKSVGEISDFDVMILGRLNDSTEGESHDIVPVSQEGASSGTILHCLSARARIMELEKLKQSRLVKAEIIGLGCKYNLASQYTSFVAIQDTTSLPDRNRRHDTLSMDLLPQVEGQQSVPLFAAAQRSRGSSRAGGVKQMKSAPRMPAASSRFSARRKHKPRQGFFDDSVSDSESGSESGSDDESDDESYEDVICGRRASAMYMQPQQQQQQQPQGSEMNAMYMQPQQQRQQQQPQAYSQAPSARFGAAHSGNAPPGADARSGYEFGGGRGGFGGGGGGGGGGYGPPRSAVRNKKPAPKLRKKKKKAKSQKESESADLFSNSAPQKRHGLEKKPKSSTKSSSSAVLDMMSFDPFGADEMDDEEEEEEAKDDDVDMLGGASVQARAPDFQVLVSLQKFDGHWDFSRELQAMGAEILAKMNDSKLFADLGASILATCLALCVFNTHFTSRKAEWAVMAAKAKKFVQKQLKAVGREGDVDALLKF